MKYGLHVSSCAEYADARVLADLARQAEATGWDGFFIWDHISMSPPEPQVDPWVALAAIAMSTERIRIGTMVTPLARRHPWKVAREAVSVDHLSKGRLALGVGLGDSGPEFEQFGLPSDPTIRAAMLDEALDVLCGLWTGEDFTYDGSHFQVRGARFTPTPVQKPRIPIWVAGFWPHKAPLRRAARYDGLFPGTLQGNMNPASLHEILAFTNSHRTSTGSFDVVIMQDTPADNPEAAAQIVAPFIEAGATWWLEPIHSWRAPFEEMRQRILAGPPPLKAAPSP